MIRAAFVALAALATTAVPFGPGTRNYDGPPPARFQSDAAVIVSFESDVSGDCGKAPPGLVTVACEFKAAKGVNVMVLPNPNQFPDDPYAQIVAHELGHRLGWKGNHPL